MLRLASVAGSTEAVAVVGISTWHAKQASLALDIDWAAPLNARLDSQAIQQALEAQAQAAADGDAGFSFHKVGDAPAQLASAAKRLNAVYKAPYLAHATLEPMNCTAQVTPQGVQVWAPTQVPGLARAVAARVADVPEDKVTVHMTQIGGVLAAALKWTAWPRPCAWRWRPAAAQCNWCGHAKKTSPMTSTARRAWPCCKAAWTRRASCKPCASAARAMPSPPPPGAQRALAGWPGGHARQNHRRRLV
ncbi:molybdopterin cofactor-binding domain-containing protein [Ideonella paludis]|uniref:molybdopterin cofactor-binding domain-containing protein n=1 Tax=Ideonella paludis TaxID=1233411 RepID=UPI00362BC37D